MEHSNSKNRLRLEQRLLFVSKSFPTCRNPVFDPKGIQ